MVGGISAAKAPALILVQKYKIKKIKFFDTLGVFKGKISG
jgi:hypothetical protein